MNTDKTPAEIWEGLTEMQRLKVAGRLPRIGGVVGTVAEVEGYAPSVDAAVRSIAAAGWEVHPNNAALRDLFGPDRASLSPLGRAVAEYGRGQSNG